MSSKFVQKKLYFDTESVVNFHVKHTRFPNMVKTYDDARDSLCVSVNRGISEILMPSPFFCWFLSKSAAKNPE